MKVLKNFHLYLIGAVAIVTAFIFNSYSLKAETGIANIHYNEILDNVELIKVANLETGKIYEVNSTTYLKYQYNDPSYEFTFRYYTHYDVTISCDSEFAFGSTNLFGNNITYSGRYTQVTIPGINSTYTIKGGGNLSSQGPASAITLHTGGKSDNYTYTIPVSPDKIAFKNIPGTIDFKYSTDLENWSSPFGVSHNTGYYKIGKFNFVGTDNDQSMYQGIFRLELPIANIENISMPEFYGMLDDEQHTINRININYYWVSYGRYNTVIYFVLNDTYTLIPWYSIETILIKYPVDTGYSYNVPLKFQFLPYDDEQYIPLYEFIQNEGKNNTNVETDNKNDQLSDKFDELNTFEQEQTENFKNSINSLDMDLNFENDIPSFTNTLSYFKDVNELMFNQIPLLKYIIIIIMIVLLWGLIV